MVECRPAQPDDFPKIAEMVNDTGYFLPVDPSTTGGIWLVARDTETEEIRATLWTFYGQGHAYLGWWVSKSPWVSVRLGAYVQKEFSEAGVHTVTAAIRTGNRPAVKMAEAMGFKGGDGYNFMHRKV